VKKLSIRPCWFQIKIAQAIYKRKDVVGTAATGPGKTLSFWIALLMALEDGEDVMEFIVTPLNILGKQTIQDLEAADIKAIAVSKENASAQTFKVRCFPFAEFKKGDATILFRILGMADTMSLSSILKFLSETSM
jgi:superfamily II DNA helicase RecQ